MRCAALLLHVARRCLLGAALLLPLTPISLSTTPAIAEGVPAGATLTVLAQPVEVALASQWSFANATDGQTLQAGDVVRTGSSGLALLTFFDGSESQLGTDSQVQILQAEVRPATRIWLFQSAGVSVNHVVPMAASGSF